MQVWLDGAGRAETLTRPGYSTPPHRVMVLYRLGRFNAAMAVLEFFRELSGSVD